MEKNNMTAVEWLIEQLHSHSGHIDVLDVANLNGYFDKAKEIEKEHIINTFKHAQVLQVMEDQKRAEQYYNETFKK